MGKIAQLRTEHFIRLLTRYGRLPLAWYRNIGPCPRQHVDTVNGFSNDAFTESGGACPLCAGTGALSKAMELPVTGKSQGKLVFQGEQERRSRMPVTLAPGEILATFLETDYPLGEGDRLILHDHLSDWAMNLRRPASGRVRLLYAPAAEVLHVIPGTATSLADSAEVPAAHYALSDDGRELVFSGAEDVLPVGGQFTVRYRYRPGYIVNGTTLRRRVSADNGDVFPSYCVLKRWHASPFDTPLGQL